MTLPAQIGPFRIVRELGRGGMGVVYEARRGEERVAVKVLLDLDAPLERFLEEAKACARLNHPNLVRLLDAGQERGRPYLAMAFVDGEPADARLRREGRLDPPAAVALTATLARAIQHVHDQGLLHRDLKPGNVLLTDQGPVLVDFGLARDEGRDRERLTKTGMLLGTPEFMAPEQAAGEVRRVGVATDVYGLGATLYALLTGGPPYTGNVVNVLHSVLKGDPPPPSTRAPGVDRDLDAIVLRCLAEVPSERYPSAGALAAALEAYQARQATPPPAGPRRGVRVATAAILLGGLVAAGLVVARSRPASPPRPSPSTAPLPDPSQDPAPAQPDHAQRCEAADTTLRETALIPDPSRLEHALAGLADVPPYAELGSLAAAYRVLLLRRLGRPEWVTQAEAASGSEDAPLAWALRLALAQTQLPPPGSGDVPQAVADSVRAELARAERQGVDDYWYFVVAFQAGMRLWSSGQLQPDVVIETCRRACEAFPEDLYLGSQLVEAYLVLPASTRAECASRLDAAQALLDAALEDVPDSSMLALQRGRLQEGRLVLLEEARGPLADRDQAREGMERDLRRAGQLDPTQELPLRLLAMRYEQEGDFVQSSDLWEQVVERAPREPLHWIALALSTRRCARWDRLFEVLRVLTDRFPGLPDTWGVAAECRLIYAFYRSTDQAALSAALTAAERFHAQAPDRPRSRAVLALARYMLSDPAWDRDLPEAPPPAPAPLLRTALACRARVRQLEPALERGDRAAAQRALDVCNQLLVAAQRDDPRQFWTFVEGIYLLDLSWTRVQPGQWGDGERYLRQLVERMPWESYFHFRLGWHLKHPIYLQRTADADLRSALPPGDPRDETALLREANLHYTRALEIDPGWAPAWKERGYARYLLEDYAAAADDLTRCLERDPNDVVASQLLAVSFQNLGEYGDALDAFLHTLELNPAHPVALRAVVELALSQGQTDTALARIDQALAVQPDLLPNRVLRAEVLEQREDWEAAREEYRSCLQRVPPDSPSVAELARRLEALEGR